MIEKEIKYLYGSLKVEVISRNSITEKGIYKVLENVIYKNLNNNKEYFDKVLNFFMIAKNIIKGLEQRF